MNKVIIMGNLTRDVELRYLSTGSAVATIGMASNRRFKRQDGSPGEEVCFVDVKLFGRTAEIANQYLKRGSRVLIEGRLSFETWSDAQGVKKSRHTIIAENMQMVDTKAQSDSRAMAGAMSQEYGDPGIVSNIGYQGAMPPEHSANYGFQPGYSDMGMGAGYANPGQPSAYGQENQRFSDGGGAVHHAGNPDHEQPQGRQSPSRGNESRNSIPEIDLDEEIPF